MIDPRDLGHTVEELADALVNAAVGIHWVAADGKILWANSAELELLGYGADEYIGHHIGEFHADELVIADILRRLTGGETLHGHEARLKAKDGSIRHVLITSNVLRRDGEFIHTRCFTRDITDRKRMEVELRATADALQATLQRFNAVLHQMPSAVAVVEAPSGRLLLANSKNEEIFRQDIVPLTGLSQYHRFRGLHADGSEIQPQEWPLSRSILSGEVVRQEEIHIVRGDGTEGYIRVSSAPIRDTEERIVAGVVTYDDVSEQRNARLALQEQGRVNELLLRIGNVLTAELDLDKLMDRLTQKATALCRAQFGAFFYDVTNDAGERVTLYALAGVLREAFAGFPMPRDPAIFGPTFAGSEVLRLDDVTKDPRFGQNPPFKGMPPGHLPVRSYLALPVKSRTGEVLGGLFFGHAEPGIFSATDQHLLTSVASEAAVAIDNARLYQATKRAEAAAQRERDRLHHLFDRAPAFIAIQHGADHVYTFVNPAAERVLNGRKITGSPLREVFPDFPQTQVDALDSVYRTGVPLQGMEIATVLDWDNNGRPYEKFFNFVYEPDRDARGEVSGVITFGFDVTDQAVARRRSESAVKELEAAARTKDEFLATVSHELRTPLNSILGWIRLLRSGNLPEDRRERALQTIERNADAQAHLIEDLLDVSRIISGKMRLEVGTVDLAQVVDAAIEAVRPAAVAKNVAVRHVIDPSASAILGDSDRLQQIVWNLVSNAVKFTAKGGAVEVAVRKEESAIQIVVSDNGRGIDVNFLPYVFERFRQADGTTTRQHGGLGLGLAIVRHLVELHGGVIAVESAGPGKGAVFTVTLPMSPSLLSSFDRIPAVRLVTRGTAGLPVPTELAGIRVLVLDDEADARDLLVQVLTTCNASVTTAGSVAEAIQMVMDSPPDVIVSDIGMPGEDGYEFIRRLRALPSDRGGRTPAVALTAYARTEDRTKALMAGFNMHVPKPVEPSELLVVLASLTALLPRS